jgi:hypothetical protein
VREGLAGLCRESPFTAPDSEAIFALTDDQQTRPPCRKKQPTHGLANEKLSLIFTPNERSLWHLESANGKQPTKLKLDGSQ